MILPIQLYTLAELFDEKKPLYLVGGAVRNRIMGLGYDDYDICSTASVEEVKKYIENTDFEIACEFERTGTIVVRKDNYKFEYTRFRRDSYALGKGIHSPKSVEFTQDIYVDACRRDFTCNAIYYNILTNEIIDPLNGVEDIENKIIRATRSADEVLSEDALRIMRMVRQAAELGLSIDRECIEAAKKYSEQLLNISVERIRDEFDKILVADIKYPKLKINNPPSSALEKLVEIGAMQYIIPEILDMIGCEQNPKYHINDVFLHTMSAVDFSPAHLRLLALLHDIAKPTLKRENGNMYGHERLGETMTRDIMKRLKYPNSEIDRTAHLVGIHMFNVDNKTRDSKCRRFIAYNYDYIDDFLAFRYADGMATNSSNYDDSSVRRLLKIKREMQDNNLPMSVSNLSINGNDLLEYGYTGREIGKKLNELWLESLDTNRVYTREELLERLNKSNKLKA